MTMPRPTDTASLLGRLDGAAAYTLRVERRRFVSSSLIEVVLAGDIATLHPEAGNDLMMAVPVEDGDGTFRRRYSIRSIDHDAGEVSLWIDVTAAGPGARWASDAPIGSTIEIIGPRGKVTLDPMADWHLFIGDLSFLPAAYAMAEAIEPPGQALFVFEIDEPTDAVVPELDPGIGVTAAFIERSGRAGDDASGLLTALGSLELPDLEGAIYIGGELHVVAAIRAFLADRGFSADAIFPKPYWRLGVANLAHGEPRKD